MNTLELRISYRPLRIGWCVRQGSFDQLRRALRLTHALWGGRYNPLIPVDDERLADQLVRVFRVDLLLSVDDDPAIQAFTSRYPYLALPYGISDELFYEDRWGWWAAVLDVYHPLQQLREETDRTSIHPNAVLFEWDEQDPLSDVLLATVGQYPPRERTGLDFSSLMQICAGARQVLIPLDAPLPRGICRATVPSTVTAYRLQSDRRSHPNAWSSGFYVGDADDFEDVVNYWNLRASDISVLFYDFQHAERFESLREEWLKFLNSSSVPESEQENRVVIRSKSRDVVTDYSCFGSSVVKSFVSPPTWNGLNIKPPLMRFAPYPALGFLSDMEEGRSVTCRLDDKPFYDGVDTGSQHFVVTLSPLTDPHSLANATFRPPYLPPTNPDLAHDCGASPRNVRCEIDGLGLITGVHDSHITLGAVDDVRLIQSIFSSSGIQAAPSNAGILSAQIIKWMGGLPGCDVFKLPEVRKLIQLYPPSRCFTKKQMKQVLTTRALSLYPDLYIGGWRLSGLGPDQLFEELLKRQVFRFGMSLWCPQCTCSFWKPIDDVKTEMKCDFCGNVFESISQLNRNCVAYQRSGMFSLGDDQQGGAIPVALTLSQIHRVLGYEWRAYTTAMCLASAGTSIPTCETDLIVVTQDREGRVSLAIGECKAQGEITDDDVSNLSRVADAMRSEYFRVFLVFAKLGEFTPREIERCKGAQARYGKRVILFAGRELDEQDKPFTKASEHLDIPAHIPMVARLEELAYQSDAAYLNPKPLPCP